MGYFDGLQFPRIDFSYLSDIGKTIGNTIESRQFGSVFKDGFPMKDGAPDYATAIDMLGRKGYTKEALSLADSAYGDSGGLGEFGLNPVKVEDPNNPGQFILIQPGRGGQHNIVRGEDGNPVRPVVSYKLVPDGRGGYAYMPSQGPVGGLLGDDGWDARSGLPQPDDEPRSTWEMPGNPTNETDPQIPEAVEPGPEWEPYRMGPADDFGQTDVAQAGQVNPLTIMPPATQDKNIDEAVGDIQGKAEQSLPAIETDLKEVLNGLNILEKDPRLSSITGMIEGNIPRGLQTQSQSEVQSILDNVLGIMWKQAFESLKGGGSITVEEGRAAADAMSTLGNQRVGTPAFRRALANAKYRMWELMNVVRRKASGPGGKKYPPLKNPYQRGVTGDDKVYDVREWLGM